MNNKVLRSALWLLVSLSTSIGAYSQAMFQNSARVSDTPATDIAAEVELADSLAFVAEPYDTVMVLDPMSRLLYTRPVYTKYRIYAEDFDPFKPELSGDAAMEWIERNEATTDRRQRLFQRFVVANPWLVRQNIAFMEKPPRQYFAEVNPSEHTIALKEIVVETPLKMEEQEVKKRHWLRTFQAGLQFSQAYVSPNWYQGGNNNLNMIANIYYNVKLNPAYHPNLLFESTLQYKLGMNSAPDDSLRNYSISEDLLQFNTTFGIKAAKRWYYSVTAQFKTQVLTSYASNTYRVTSAFLAPAEFTAGVGMTYNYANEKKTVTFDASIAPLSYNMKICVKPDDVLPHSAYGIDADKKYVMDFGSSAEAKLSWKICDNISLRSRVFIFTDYDYIQADWENTVAMDINRYLSTQIYVHARYDSSTPRCDDPSWHKLQLKEILSFGVTYKFSSI